MADVETDTFGRRAGYGAHSVDQVLFAAADWMSVRKIEEEVKRRGLPPRGAVREHLEHLLADGFVQKKKEGRFVYYRVSNRGIKSSGSVTISAPPDIPAQVEYEPDEVDARMRQLRNVPQRPSQAAFRDSLLSRYGRQCQVTGTRVLETLEAAHICGYLGEKDNHPANGLILRADIHALFDNHLVGIEPQSLVIRVSDVAASDYRNFDRKKLQLGKAINGPSIKALNLRWQLYASKLHVR